MYQTKRNNYRKNVYIRKYKFVSKHYYQADEKHWLDLMTQLHSFFLAFDESTDLTDTAQLLIYFIRGINTVYNIIKELASLEIISVSTTGTDIFESELLY